VPPEGKNDYRPHLQRGIELFKAGGHAEAVKELDAALALNPEVAEAYYFKGLAFFEMKDYEAAESSFAYAEMYDRTKNVNYGLQRQRSHELVQKEKGYAIRYGGGHVAFPGEMEARVLVEDGGLEIKEMGLKVPYERVTQIRTEAREGYRLSMVVLLLIAALLLILFLGLILGGLIAAVILIIYWQTARKDRMILGYRDEVGLEQVMWFEGDISTLQNVIYKMLLEARGKEKKAGSP